jgi:hypothetical protein
MNSYEFCRWMCWLHSWKYSIKWIPVRYRRKSRGTSASIGGNRQFIRRGLEQRAVYVWCTKATGMRSWFPRRLKVHYLPLFGLPVATVNSCLHLVTIFQKSYREIGLILNLLLLQIYISEFWKIHAYDKMKNFSQRNSIHLVQYFISLWFLPKFY